MRSWKGRKPVNKIPSTQRSRSQRQVEREWERARRKRTWVRGLFELQSFLNTLQKSYDSTFAIIFLFSKHTHIVNRFYFTGSKTEARAINELSSVPKSTLGALFLTLCVTSNIIWGKRSIQVPTWELSPWEAAWCQRHYWNSSTSWEVRRLTSLFQTFKFSQHSWVPGREGHQASESPTQCKSSWDVRNARVILFHVDSLYLVVASCRKGGSSSCRDPQKM